MSTPNLRATDEALVAALQGDGAVASYAPGRRVFSFWGPLKHALEEGAKARPALLVRFEGSITQRDGASQLSVQTWAVYAFDRNARSEAAGRAPDAAGETGTATMVEDVSRVIGGSVLGLDGLDPIEIGDVEVVPPEKLKGDRRLSVLRVGWTITRDLGASLEGPLVEATLETPTSTSIDPATRVLSVSYASDDVSAQVLAGESRLELEADQTAELQLRLLVEDLVDHDAQGATPNTGSRLQLAGALWDVTAAQLDPRGAGWTLTATRRQGG